MRLEGGKALSPRQLDYLTAQSLLALLDHAWGLTSPEDFRIASLREKEERRMHRAQQEIERKEAEIRKADWLAESQRKMTEIFAARERKRARRRHLDDFGLFRIAPEAFARVDRIARKVRASQPIDEPDLEWLAEDGKEYATDALMAAHHRALALALAQKWREGGDPWDAVNACASWRKAGEPDEGRKIAGQALGKTSGRRPRSALCTTRGGALRDLRRPDEGKRMGLEAHGLSPGDYRPCTLLGACHIDLSDYAQADEWFLKAEERGAGREAIDAEIRAILAAAAPERRKEIVTALRARAPERYARLR